MEAQDYIQPRKKNPGVPKLTFMALEKRVTELEKMINKLTKVKEEKPKKVLKKD